MKKHAPAAIRNREPIAQVLAKELPETARSLVLEVASGSGEHALFFAERFPHLDWQPTDYEEAAVASIAAYRSSFEGDNLLEPLRLDAAGSEWLQQFASVDAIVCTNMVHISPWEATLGLIAGAGHLLSGKNAPLVLYGPYFEQGVEAAPSNLAFDQSLRSRNEQWGIRFAEELDKVAADHGLARSARYEMPANNLMLVYRP